MILIVFRRADLQMCGSPASSLTIIVRLSSKATALDAYGVTEIWQAGSPAKVLCPWALVERHTGTSVGVLGRAAGDQQNSLPDLLRNRRAALESGRDVASLDVEVASQPARGAAPGAPLFSPEGRVGCARIYP